jgi:hypothetical protein
MEYSKNLLAMKDFIIRMHEDKPLPKFYTGNEMAGIYGCRGKRPVEITLYNTALRERMTDAESGFNTGYTLSAFSESRIVYRISVKKEDMVCISFDLFYETKSNELSFGFEKVKEEGEWHFVSIKLPAVISVTSCNPEGRIALTARSGRLIDPDRCAVGETFHRQNWILDSFCTHSVAYTHDITAVLSLNSFEDQLVSCVEKVETSNIASLGVLFRYRYTCLDSSYHRAI